ncbi:MAG TPA: hypothetical protein VNJ54_10915 [Plantibacter sp.]|uniref:hypothetical protein n=1 Tax=unclassified Plantibacter TaxID=2624265 RepID=UPI002D0E9D89|nr:hypothetical protein [Plantibacter sp.]
MPIRPSRWILPAVPIAVALAALTACTSPAPAPTPIATTKPVLENEEQALAAVTSAYEDFQRLSTLILSEGGSGPERIEAVASPALSKIEQEAFAEVARDGLSVTGEPRVQSVQVLSWFGYPDAIGVIASAAFCVDISAVDVLASDGRSLVGADRPASSSWVAEFALLEGQNALVVHSRDKREGDCA